jgi:hypothetical protein
MREQIKITYMNLSDAGPDVDFPQATYQQEGTDGAYLAQDFSWNTGSAQVSGAIANGTGATKTYRVKLWSRRSYVAGAGVGIHSVNGLVEVTIS